MLQVSKVQLTVKADNKSKPFDGLPFTPFTSTISGFVNGESSLVVSGSVTYGGNAVGATGVGTYEITPGTGGLSAKNYSFAGANGTLTIGAWYATGFYEPVGVDSSEFVASGGAVPTISATGVWNTAKGGSTVPLKFNLYNSQAGTQLTSTSSVQSFDLVKLDQLLGHGRGRRGRLLHDNRRHQPALRRYRRPVHPELEDAVGQRRHLLSRERQVPRRLRDLLLLQAAEVGGGGRRRRRRSLNRRTVFQNQTPPWPPTATVPHKRSCPCPKEDPRPQAGVLAQPCGS